MVPRTKILFLASNPADTSRLRLDEEVRGITSRFRDSEHRDALELVSRWSVRPDDLLQELNAERPAVVHFSGHGSRASELVLANDAGLARPVSPSALKALFDTLGDGVRLVMLNACHYGEQARSVAQAVGCAIGMNRPIGDTAARVFAASFYRAIGFGRSVKDAFDQGKASLLLEGSAAENTPELHTREGVDPSQVFLVHAAPPDFADRICGDWWGIVSTQGHESVLACIRIEFKYLFEGKRHDQPGMTLLFGNADVSFELPTDSGAPIRRGQSEFVSVHKSAEATSQSWGEATLRSQSLARAEDSSAFESLWAAVLPAQRAPLVDRIGRAVFGLP